MSLLNNVAGLQPEEISPTQVQCTYHISHKFANNKPELNKILFSQAICSVFKKDFGQNTGALSFAVFL